MLSNELTPKLGDLAFAEPGSDAEIPDRSSSQTRALSRAETRVESQQGLRGRRQAIWAALAY